MRYCHPEYHCASSRTPQNTTPLLLHPVLITWGLTLYYCCSQVITGVTLWEVAVMVRSHWQALEKTNTERTNNKINPKPGQHLYLKEKRKILPEKVLFWIQLVVINAIALNFSHCHSPFKESRHEYRGEWNAMVQQTFVFHPQIILTMCHCTHCTENTKFPIRANFVRSGVNLSFLLRDCKFNNFGEVISDLWRYIWPFDSLNLMPIEIILCVKRKKKRKAMLWSFQQQFIWKEALKRSLQRKLLLREY